jgi:hypothetical protein
VLHPICHKHTSHTSHKAVVHADSAKNLTYNRYCEELAQLTLTIARLSSLKGKQGVAGKDSHSMRDSAAKKIERVDECLQEINLWRQEVGLATPALTQAEVNDMLRTGVVPAEKLLGDGGVTQRARMLYFGKLYFITRHEVARLQEERRYIPKEYISLDWWVRDKLNRVDVALAREKAVAGDMPDIWDLKADDGRVKTDSTLLELLQLFLAPPGSSLSGARGLGGCGDHAAAAVHSHGRQFAIMEKRCQLQLMHTQLRRFNARLPADNRLPQPAAVPRESDMNSSYSAGSQDSAQDSDEEGNDQHASDSEVDD